ncbi:hypothetical protein GCM10019017_26890 [Streptomyces showdoensis]
MLGRRGEMAFGRKRRRELINDDQVLSQYGSNKRPVGGSRLSLPTSGRYRQRGDLVDSRLCSSQ